MHLDPLAQIIDKVGRRPGTTPHLSRGSMTLAHAPCTNDVCVMSTQKNNRFVHKFISGF